MGVGYHTPTMTGRHTKNLTTLPLSGDRLTDWIFKQFVFFLRRETLQIRRKKRLVDPDDPHRKAVRGLMDPAGHTGRYINILINSAKSTHANRDEEVETLIHELSHVVFWKTQEHFICQAENILVKRFTRAQRVYLKSFLPRHEVKRYPKFFKAIRNILPFSTSAR